ncbi:MAG: potassium-transporting ATPase subunit F [Nitrospinae bacterium]|nr:potassium-transporting ATPase subunit F [Nitrospinota bacterium]
MRHFYDFPDNLRRVRKTARIENTGRCQRGDEMGFVYVVLSALILIYLIYVMFRPERF